MWIRTIVRITTVGNVNPLSFFDKTPVRGELQCHLQHHRTHMNTRVGGHLRRLAVLKFISGNSGHCGRYTPPTQHTAHAFFLLHATLVMWSLSALADEAKVAIASGGARAAE